MEKVNNWITRVNMATFGNGYQVTVKGSKIEYKDYHEELHNIGTWLVIKGDDWVCMSSIKDLEEFKGEFLKVTGLNEKDVAIKRVSVPIIL